ncbi:MAG TPA: AI-2E family transporter [Candidatus Colwellbacteria bacterium]|nr:AI-2E family transporter [Candidatus Colwellbacteria bacterium]HQA95993.1 AI-2E family transporter [Candidatus Colwellbacteria bacterium]
MEKRELEISWGTLWRVVATIAAVAFLYAAHEALLVLVFALIISSALDGLVSWLEERKIPRLLGTIFIFLAVSAVLVFILYEVVPLIFWETAKLVESYQGIGDFFGENSVFLEGMNKTLMTEDFGSRVVDAILEGASPFISAVGGLLGGVVFLATVFIASFYLTLSRDGVERLLRVVFPAQAEEYIIKIYLRVKKRIGRWMQVQMILSLVIGLMVFAGLWLMGVDYSLLIGVLAGLFEIVPMVGPILAGAIAVAVAFSESMSLAIIVFVFFVVIQQLENNILVPVLMRKAVNIHPVIVIIALMAGFEASGVVGAILAVPVAVVVQEIVEDKLRRKAAEASGR